MSPSYAKQQLRLLKVPISFARMKYDPAGTTALETEREEGRERER